jgi:hypothetical protein
MATLGQAVRALEEQFFVGRDHELDLFRHWLVAAPNPPEILSVSGPGGVGKSALLGAFQRYAIAQGWSVVFVDGRTIRTPESLVHALGGARLDDATERLNRARSLLLIDAYDDLLDLTRYLLDEVLPHMETGVRVAIAGRYPLMEVWARDDAWQRLVRPLPLSGLPPDRARAFLTRRGLDDRPRLVDEIFAATRGYPLGLSLAADLANRQRLQTLEAASEWPSVLRALVQRLHETEDPRVQQLLEAAALVRHFDEGTLAAIAGEPAGPTAFASLCRLSVVRPAQHGLMLHDDVRRILAAELRWRDPGRYADLRQRALDYYRGRSTLATAADKEWLLTERLLLWEDAVAQAILVADEDLDEVWLAPGRPEDHDDVAHLWEVFVDRVLPVEMRPDDPGREQAFLRTLLQYPDVRLRIARDRPGQALGFSLVMPVCGQSLPFLDSHSGISALVHAYLGATDLAAMPTRARDTRLFYLLHSAHSDTLPKAVSAALLRDLCAVLAGGHTYLASTPFPAYKQFFVRMGWNLVPAARNCWWSSNLPVDGYVLDLTRIGVEPWVAAIMAGRSPPTVAQPRDLERAVQAALLHWEDDGWLTTSELWESGLFSLTPIEGRRGPELRRIIGSALTSMEAASDVDQRFACHALDVAYMTHGVSHEAAAERLAVSRATLYRLLKRGIHGLAVELTKH